MMQEYVVHKFLRSIISSQQVLTDHHIKPTSSYGSSYQDKSSYGASYRSNRDGAPNCATPAHRASRHGLPVTPAITYAALPSSYAIVRMCALRFRRIKRLSWSLRRRLPSRCCRSRRSLEVGAHGILLFRRPSGRSGRSCVVLQHERSAILEQCAERGDVGNTSRGSRHNGREALWQKSLCAGASPHAEQSAMRRRNG